VEDTATVRLALAACARNLTGKPPAGSIQRRKRSVFYNALGYAVGQGHLASNPVDRIQWYSGTKYGVVMITSCSAAYSALTKESDIGLPGVVGPVPNICATTPSSYRSGSGAAAGSR
jgi:hypothetical protein